MGNAKNVRWIIPFKKFGMVRVKTGLTLLTQITSILSTDFNF